MDEKNNGGLDDIVVPYSRPPLLDKNNAPFSKVVFIKVPNWNWK
tara:strand:- start:2479 stop:2610 length:132 start_codon:yes stop_codon:yes gene_type:complete